ncbi:MAG TPA: NAD(P)/FAD-dependent oxidoreductase [Nevskiaceae bacterium]|nr:NAD(P)/FAD-dependent oxidoreductase [Nevskiaceae bacterium]
MSAEADVLIIGGGAAGLFCAIEAARRGRRVTVLERADRVGKKILMSGGGRCNFTNREVGPQHYLSANPHFCKSALARYRPEAFIARVDAHGIGWHEKELGQLFCNESSKQIVRMLTDECAEAGVRILCNWSVESLTALEGGFEVRSSSASLRASRVVVASGGLSVPTLGGSDIGYRLAQQFGHRLQPLRAGLVPLTLSGRPLEQWQDLAGVSLPVEARSGRMAFRNALLITHRGISGPAVLQISNYWQPGEPLTLRLCPELDWPAWLAEQKAAQGERELRSLLAEVLPRRFVQRYAELHLPAAGEPVKRLQGARLQETVSRLQQWPLVISGTEGYRTAEVTLGGIATDEISSTHFESRRQPGLHFIGELLDVTGWLGGYNFQWAWASAHACAQAL